MKKSKISEFLDEMLSSRYRGGEGWGYAVPKHPFFILFIELVLCLIVLGAVGAL